MGEDTLNSLTIVIVAVYMYIKLSYYILQTYTIFIFYLKKKEPNIVIGAQ